MIFYGLKSQSIVGRSYLDGVGDWGAMDPTKNELFIDWLVQNGIITCKWGEPIRKDALPSEKMFTNNFLPTSNPEHFQVVDEETTVLGGVRLRDDRDDVSAISTQSLSSREVQCTSSSSSSSAR